MSLFVPISSTFMTHLTSPVLHFICPSLFLGLALVLSSQLAIRNRNSQLPTRTRSCFFFLSLSLSLSTYHFPSTSRTSFLGEAALPSARARLQHLRAGGDREADSLILFGVLPKLSPCPLQQRSFAMRAPPRKDSRVRWLEMNAERRDPYTNIRLRNLG